jgi:hypothetical protein
MARGRRREDWAQLVDAWRKSGESQRAFAMRHRIGVSTLQSWVQREREDPAPARLVEVRVAEHTRIEQIEIHLPSGVTLRVPVGCEPAWTSSLVKLLAG